jgi:general stress protein YciG
MTSRPHGFAAMDPEKQREIAAQGGRTAHARGRAHEFTSEEGRIAGRKGGALVSRNHDHMVEIGRRGGQARSRRRGSEETRSESEPSS